MPINHYRRNPSAGMSTAPFSRPMRTASSPMFAGPTGSLRNTGAAPYAYAVDFDSTTAASTALMPKAPVSRASFPAASFPPPGNVVELYPGAGATRKTRRTARLVGSEAGMATAEYAIATLAAVGFAGLLVFILRSDEVRGFLLNLIRTALALP
ncbi:DUF4244 domain-containing protein [Arthrobacter sp. SAFR-044]|uniref:DUF4244 domain-containing protein n=1 Tax=Arthrobacter sp. SAFR-044 TaxID=3387278 RepID=UPI003F7B7800